MQLMYKFIWLIALFNAVLYLFYFIYFLTGKAGPPLGDEDMGYGAVLFSCLIFSMLPFLGLWLGQNFNITQMSDGYHKVSEFFFTVLIFVFTVVMLRMYYLQILPIL